MLIKVEVPIPQGNNLVNGKVIERSKESIGEMQGSYNDDSLLNTLVYDGEFPDETIREYGANQIAQNMHAHMTRNGQLWYYIRSSIILGMRMQCQRKINMLRQDQKEETHNFNGGMETISPKEG